MTENVSHGIRRRLSNLNRLRQVLQVFARHGFSGFVDQLGISDGALAAQPAAGEKVAARFGRRLMLAFADLGPTFVKLGQILGTREDILPPVVARELKELTDHAPPFAASLARERVRLELGSPPEALFDRFDDAPLASASIAQVHRARLRDGREVVVKIRRPGIEKTIDDDLALLEALADLVSTRIPESRPFDPTGLVREFERSIRGELDFGLEARSVARLRLAVGGTALVPRALPEWSREGILTLEFLEGRRVDRLSDPRERRTVAVRLLESFIRQYLRAGFFHADPHPGNILVLEGSRIAFLDLGAVGTVTRPMRRLLVSLASAAIQRNGRRTAEAILAMSEPAGPVDREAYLAEATPFLEDVFSRRLGELNVNELLGEVFSLTRRYHLRLSSEYFLLVRSAATLDGVLRNLAPDLDAIAVSKVPVLQNLLAGGWLASGLRLAFGLFLFGRGRVARAFRAGVASVVAVALVAGGLWAGRRHLGWRVEVPAAVIRFLPQASLRRTCDVRRDPERNAPVVLRAKKGTRVRVVGRVKELVEVVLPGDVRGFVRPDEVE